MLDETLSRKLGALRGTLRRTLALAGLAVPALAVPAWFVVSLLGDRLIEPAVATRAVFLAAGVLGVLYLIWRYVLSPSLRRITDDDLAVIVERHWPDLDNRVISTVQLSRLADPAAANMSPALIRQLAADAAGQTAALDFSDAVDRRRGLRGPGALLLAAALPAAVAFSFPGELNLWARRALLLQDIPRPHDVKLVLREPSGPGEVVRRIGDSVTLSVEADPDHKMPEVVEVHASAAASSGNGWVGLLWDRLVSPGRPLAILTEYGTGRFRGAIEKLEADVELYVRGGDDEVGPVRVRVVKAVTCTGMTLDCRFPDYIGEPAKRLQWGRRIVVPAGTAIELSGTADKELSAAEVRLPAELGDSVVFGAGPAVKADDGKTLVRRLEAADVSGSTFRTRFAVSRSTSLQFVLTDTDGLTNFTATRPVRLDIEVQPDRAPVAGLRIRGIGDMVTATAKVPMEISLRDDHGLASARVVARLLPTAEQLSRDPKAAAVELKPAFPLAGRPSPFGKGEKKIEFREVWELGPLGLEVGRRIELDVRAADFRPQIGGLDERSRKIVEVVSPETLRLRLLERQIQLRAELDQKIRAQQDLLGDLERAAEADRAAAMSDDTFQGVRKVSRAQQRLADDVARLLTAFTDLSAEMENNGVGSPSELARLSEINEGLRRLLDERLNLLPTGLQTPLNLLAGSESLLTGWDLDADGSLDFREWGKCRRLLDELDPRREFPEAELGPGMSGLNELFLRLDADRDRRLGKEELARGQAVLKVRLMFLLTGTALQRDALERMRRIRRLLPRSEKFSAIIQGVRQLMDRQREALQSTRKAGDQAAEDLFDK